MRRHAHGLPLIEGVEQRRGQLTGRSGRDGVGGDHRRRTGGRGIADDADSFLDLDANGMPDRLAPETMDLDSNSIPDGIQGIGPDLNGNGITDGMDPFLDFNNNGIPDSGFYD